MPTHHFARLVRMLPLTPVLLFAVAVPVSAEIHWQCTRSRCALPPRNYTTREPVQGASVTSPLTASVSVEQVLSPARSALVPMDELDALQAEISRGVGPGLVPQQNPAARFRDPLRTLPAPVPGGVDPRRSSPTLPLPGDTLSRAEAQFVDRVDPRFLPLPANSPAGTVLRGADPSTTAGVRRSIRSKTFRGGPDVRLPNGVRLEGHLLTIYETGEAAFNGVLWHDGGPYASRQGSRVKITIRALGSSEAYEVGRADGPLYWETTDERWVPKGQPQRLRLTMEPSPEIRAHFNEINRLEVNLESPTIR